MSHWSFAVGRFTLSSVSSAPQDPQDVKTDGGVTGVLPFNLPTSPSQQVIGPRLAAGPTESLGFRLHTFVPVSPASQGKWGLKSHLRPPRGGPWKRRHSARPTGGRKYLGASLNIWNAFWSTLRTEYCGAISPKCNPALNHQVPSIGQGVTR